MNANASDERMAALGRLAAQVAHDLNNQLMAVLGFCDLALLSAEPDSQLAKDLQEIRSAGERAARLTGQLLASKQQGA